MKYLRWLLKGTLGLLIVVILAAAGLWLFLPDRYVVNTPIMALFESQPVDREALDSRLELPDGFSLSLYATDLDGIRVVRATTAGDLIVSTPRTSKVWLVRRPRGGKNAEKQVLLENLNRPHGVEAHGGWLYVAETDAVGRIRFDAEAGTVSGQYEKIVTHIPEGGMHWTRTIRRAPDGWFYLTVGSNCNACEDQPLRAAMHRFKADGSGFETFATGLRNSVDFSWAPWDDRLYATDNGRDLLGDDIPPCELNEVIRNGFYGWPYSWGDRQPDPDLGADNPEKVASSTGPVHGFKAHTAPLGIVFLDGSQLPAAYQRSALVAQHGSWNRSRKSGYRVVSLHWDSSGTISERDFLTGFELDEEVIGRPAFVEQGPDGAIYISDDFNGSIYRVAYSEQPINTDVTPTSASSVSSDNAPSSTVTHSTEALAQQITTGEELYQQYDCASCHHPDRAAEGMVIVPLVSLHERYSQSSLSDFLAAPTPPMPAFPLTGNERDALAAYLLNGSLQ
ncbi:MAG: PQQ-dependent sugar dehydrogenase [Immundisolibacteraceae bacterium]|nr:PQQ-dependent sugar dehydrogenase [Immundisolibacteraceae bacterium]